MAEDKEKTLQAAQKYVDRKQYDKAIREYQKILQDSPDDLRVMLRMVPCYENLGEYNEAGSICWKIGCQYRADGAYQKALAAFKQAQRFLPESDEIAIGMADLYNALGLQHEAVNQLENCLYRYQHLQDSENYARILQMMVRVDSENVPTRIRYAAYLVKAGDLDGAARQYTLALAQLLSKERYVDYIQTARDYLKLSPKDSDVLENLARIYIKMNRFADAVVFLSTLKSDERSPEVRELLVSCYIKMHREREAVEELKLLARQYEQEGNRQDIIEDVWLRAQKLAPNDPDVNAALNGGEPPMLSESALNVLSSVDSERSHMQSHVSGSSSIGDPNNERLIRHRMADAERYYQAGNIQEARQLCLQIIDLDDQHLPALNMLSEIYAATHDKLSLAQCERKIAKAVFEQSPDEAAKHIMNAERCTPGAWENYNLMMVLGLDPARYGLRAPVSTSPARPIGLGAIPPIPTKSPMGKPPLPPPIPKPGGVRPGLGSPRKLVRTIEIPEPIQSIPGDVLDELKTLEQSQIPVSSKIKAGMVQDADSAQKPVTRSSDKVKAACVQRAVEITDSSNLNGISSIGRAVSNDLDDVFMNFFNEPSEPSPAASQKEEAKPNGIPDSDRQKVMDAIQEIDFYASLMLMDDAEKMLAGLIEKYGDVDIIHEAKLRLEK